MSYLVAIEFVFLGSLFNYLSFYPILKFTWTHIIKVVISYWNTNGYVPIGRTSSCPGLPPRSSAPVLHFVLELSVDDSSSYEDIGRLSSNRSLQSANYHWEWFWEGASNLWSALFSCFLAQHSSEQPVLDSSLHISNNVIFCTFAFETGIYYFHVIFII